MASMTQVRQNPAVTGSRRDIAEGLNRRISCIQRMYSSGCGRWAASGSSPRSARITRDYGYTLAQLRKLRGCHWIALA